MYRIESGSTLGLADTAGFVELLNGLRDGPSQSMREFFGACGDLFVARAPGRLDVMGGIADYSGSLVLELPIAEATFVALQKDEERTLRIFTLSETAAGGSLFEMPLADFERDGGPVGYEEARAYFARDPARRWAAYAAGVFLVLMRERGANFGAGARMLVSSRVPAGKGVSSSAALEVAAMSAVAAAFRLELDARELALLCQRVENSVVGAPCGVMDQMTSACGEADRLLALLCQPGELQGTVQLPAELAVWGVDSGIRHAVSGEDYGTVRTAAFMGYRMIAEMAGLAWRAGAKSGHVVVDDPRWHGYLANITPAEFEQHYASQLPARMSGAEFLERYKGITDTVTSVNPARKYPVRQATQHPVCEHKRINAFAQILRDWRGGEQAAALGDLMCRSHRSYTACGLGSPGTDELVRLAREMGAGAGFYGAKITGGGSGGTVAVLARKGAEQSIAALTAEYKRRTGHTPVVISGSSPGAASFGHLRLTRKGTGEGD